MRGRILVGDHEGVYVLLFQGDVRLTLCTAVDSFLDRMFDDTGFRSVVVDLAGETGGNCELTEPGQTVVKHGVTIASPLNLPATMPEHASELYSKNITALLDLLITDGALAPDFDDEVIAGACVTREGN